MCLFFLFLRNEGIYVARYMKGVTVKWFVIHVVYQSIGVAVILTGQFMRLRESQNVFALVKID